MSDIGHNLPPDMAATAGEVTKDLSSWLSEHPVIQNEDDARAAKLLVDRAILCVSDLEAERKGKTGPLNEQVKTINDYYRGPREILEGITYELRRRFDAFLLLEERKRIAAAEEATRLAALAEQKAKDAEAKERETIEDATAGIVGLDIAAVTVNADRAFAEYQKAERQAALAERETKVKIGGGFRRSASLRDKEVLTITNCVAAIEDIGLTEKIAEAIESGARAYRKLHGKYPRGIACHIERKS